MKTSRITTYTINTIGNNVSKASENGYHAYYSSYTNVTAIEVKAKSKADARKKIKSFAKAVYVFE